MMKRSKFMERFLLFFTLAVFTGIGFVISYTIQFKLNMFGANHITIDNIIGLWMFFSFAGFMSGLYVYIVIFDRLMKKFGK